MSQENTTENEQRGRRPRRKLIAVIVGAVAGLVALAMIFSPSSGADFTASDTGKVQVETATLSLNLSDAGHSGTFDLKFANVKPGDTVTRTFYVKNTGTITATAKVGQPLSGITVPSGLSTADFAELQVGFMGATPAPVTSLTSSVNLGSVAPGHTLAVPVTVHLSSSAGNEWQGKVIGATGTVTLTQS